MKELSAILAVILAALAIEAHAGSFDACVNTASIVAKNPALDGSRKVIEPGSTVILRGVAEANALTLQIPTDGEEIANFGALAPPWNLRIEVADCAASIQVDEACLPVGHDAVACAEAVNDLVAPVQTVDYTASGIQVTGGYIPAASSNMVIIKRQSLFERARDQIFGGAK